MVPSPGSGPSGRQGPPREPKLTILASKIDPQSSQNRAQELQNRGSSIRVFLPFGVFFGLGFFKVPGPPHTATDRDRQTDRDTQRQTGRTERQSDSHTDAERDTPTPRQTDRKLAEREKQNKDSGAANRFKSQHIPRFPSPRAGSGLHASRPEASADLSHPALGGALVRVVISPLCVTPTSRTDQNRQGR